MKVLLTIAGFDPSSGAGVSADQAVFAAHGAYGMAAITAMTVQSTRGVRRVHALSADLLGATLDMLLEDVTPDGVKIGMLGTLANVEAVATFLSRHAGRFPSVLDPVLRSSSGSHLMEPDGVRALRETLLPLVDWITPNRDELGWLAGQTVADEDGVLAACKTLREAQPKLNLVATGGDGDASDLVYAEGDHAEWLRGERIESRSTHGTGCAFSSALLCGLVDGLSGFAAASAAKRYVTEAIRRAPGIGQGRGPMELLWPLRDASGE